MNKMSKLAKIALIVFAIVVILIGGFVVMVLQSLGFFVTDRSVEVYLEEMVWNGREYTEASGEYSEGKTIARSKDGWNLNEVKEDPSHNFVVIRSFLDQYLYVASDYTIPKSGEVTKVCWNGKYITNKKFIDAVTKIEAERVTSFEYETEGIYMLTDNQHMRKLVFAYEGCPVATERKGYMGKVNGEWVITTYISPDQFNEDGSDKPYSVSCYIIPEEYASILEKYFS